jgi:tRNA pseudouridine38-40 synthase
MQETQRWKLTFQFDGSNFKGWQRQPDERTVEGVIEEAFSTLFQADIDLIGQGRTDAGVHALAQTAHADLPDRYSADRILHAMKGLLPEDVALMSAEPVHADFHARFDAVSRAYKYQISTKPIPLNRQHYWFYDFTPDAGILHECSALIDGEHDFINFCIPSEAEFGTTICTINESRWEVHSDRFYYHIEGNRFLRHMVRRLVGSMINCAQNKLNINDFQKLISGNTVKKKGHAAPAKGLILKKVNY